MVASNDSAQISGGRLDKPITAYLELIETTPDLAKNELTLLSNKLDRNAKVWWLLGLCYRKLGKDKLAVRALESAVQIDSKFCEALEELGDALAEGQRLEKATTYYRRLANINYRDYYIRMKLARALLSMRYLEEATEAFRLATKMTNIQVEAFSSYAECLASMNKTDEAIKTYEEAQEKFPGNMFDKEISKLRGQLVTQGRMRVETDMKSLTLYAECQRLSGIPQLMKGDEFEIWAHKIPWFENVGRYPLPIVEFKWQDPQTNVFSNVPTSTEDIRKILPEMADDENRGGCGRFWGLNDLITEQMKTSGNNMSAFRERFERSLNPQIETALRKLDSDTNWNYDKDYFDSKSHFRNCIKAGLALAKLDAVKLASLIAALLNVNKPVPLDQVIRWFWYCQGYWPLRVIPDDSLDTEEISWNDYDHSADYIYDLTISGAENEFWRYFTFEIT